MHAVQLLTHGGLCIAWASKHMLSATTVILLPGHALLRAAWRQALPEDGQLTVCERDERPLALAQRFWQKAGVEHKVSPRLGLSSTSCDQRAPWHAHELVHVLCVCRSLRTFSQRQTRCMLFCKRVLQAATTLHSLVSAPGRAVVCVHGLRTCPESAV